MSDKGLLVSFMLGINTIKDCLGCVLAPGISPGMHMETLLNEIEHEILTFTHARNERVHNDVHKVEIECIQFTFTQNMNVFVFWERVRCPSDCH